MKRCSLRAIIEAIRCEAEAEPVLFGCCLISAVTGTISLYLSVMQLFR